MTAHCFPECKHLISSRLIPARRKTRVLVRRRGRVTHTPMPRLLFARGAIVARFAEALSPETRHHKEARVPLHRALAAKTVRTHVHPTRWPESVRMHGISDERRHENRKSRRPWIGHTFETQRAGSHATTDRRLLQRQRHLPPPTRKGQGIHRIRQGNRGRPPTWHRLVRKRGIGNGPSRVARGR